MGKDIEGRTKEFRSPKSPHIIISWPSFPDPLSELPRRILLKIVAELPASSAAALALCSHALYTKLGTKSLQTIRQGQLPDTALYELWKRTFRGERLNSTHFQKERQLLLLLLQRDIGDCVYCFYCQKIHGLDANKYFVAGMRGLCLCSRVLLLESGAASRNWWPRDFVFTHFQVARIQFERGVIKSGRVPKLSVKRSVQRQSIGGSKIYRHRRSIETRIGTLGFFMKEKHRVTFDVDRSLYANTRGIPDVVRMPLVSYDIQLCDHLFLTSNAWSKQCEDLIQCTFSHPLYKGCLKCSCLHQCKLCHTEWEFGIRLLVNKWKITFTVWKDLEMGESPFSTKWISHFSSEVEEGGTIVCFVPGSIREYFDHCRAPLKPSILSRLMERGNKLKKGKRC